MTLRTRQIIAGILFLAAFFTYGTGTMLATGFVSGLAASVDPAMILATYGNTLISGVLLMLLNSLIVLAIAILLFPSLARVSRATSWIYMLTRAGEAVLLALGALGFLNVLSQRTPHAIAAVQSGNFFAYQAGMLVLGFGSLFLCALLYRHRLVPRLLAGWGFIGYGLLMIGALLALRGAYSGILLSLPGGVFELVFGVWLISKGLPPTPPPSAAPRAGDAP
jgi:hypothetical protein